MKLRRPKEEPDRRTERVVDRLNAVALRMETVAHRIEAILDVEEACKNQKDEK